MSFRRLAFGPGSRTSSPLYSPVSNSSFRTAIGIAVESILFLATLGVVIFDASSSFGAPIRDEHCQLPNSRYAGIYLASVSLPEPCAIASKPSNLFSQSSASHRSRHFEGPAQAAQIQSAFASWATVRGIGISFNEPSCLIAFQIDSIS